MSEVPKQPTKKSIYQTNQELKKIISRYEKQSFIKLDNTDKNDDHYSILAS